MSKDKLHNLIDLLPESEIDVIFKVLVKFIPHDVPTEDEREAILRGHMETSLGEIENLEDIDWNR